MVPRYLLLLAICQLSCLPSPAFLCDGDESCGAGGLCEPDGYCSFGDDRCESGQRYSAYAGPEVAEQCVPGPCRRDALFDRITGSCYLASTESATWDTARILCMEVGSGWGLAKVDVLAENDFLAAQIGDASHWLGGNDLDGTWQWFDGEPLQVDVWDQNEPSMAFGDDCMALDSTSGRWHARACNDSLAYHCERHR
jgi:hypothetical protein